MRDYSFDIKADRTDSFFFAVDDEHALYNPFERRIILTRSHYLPRSKRPRHIAVSRREADEGEHDKHEERRQMLLGYSAPPVQQLLTDKSAGPPLPAPADADGDGAAAAAGDDDAADGDDDADPFGDAGAPVEDEEGGGDGLIDDEPSQPEWRAASDERNRASRSRDPSDDF